MTTPTHLYVALGDSITEGYSAPHKKGFATRLARRLNERTGSVAFINTGKKGLTSSQLVSLLHSPPFARAVSMSSLLTLGIGGNDLLYAYAKYFVFRNPQIYRQAIRTYKENLHRIYTRISGLSRAPLFTLNMYNPFPHSTSARTWVPLLNQATEEISEKWAIPVLDVHRLFLGRESQLIHGYHTGRLTDIRFGSGGYPVHPNRQGHSVIGDALWEAVGAQKDSRTG